MQISDSEVKRVLAGQSALIEDIRSLEEGLDDPIYEIDPELVAKVTREVMQMPDREDRIAELKAKIEAGTYNPTGDEIADAMIRRAIADRLR